MENISREEAIKDLNALIKIANKDLSTDEIIRNSCTKAISDMQKLEKIEKLYEHKPFGEGLSREDRDREIEQILKEGAE